MGQAFTPGLFAGSGVALTRVRELPVVGEILKKIGDSVRSDEVVARGLLPGDLTILRVSESLGIEPFEVLKGLKVKEGDAITSGMLLCEHVGLFGLFKSRFVAPLTGTVDFISAQTGHVGVRLAPREIALDAYLTGQVVAVEPQKSVTIATTATLVQGIFGVGGERQGELHLLPIAPNRVLTTELLPTELQGQIVVGGTQPSLEVLTTAARRGARGLVVGAIDDRALSGYLGFDLGVAITGDEKVPMTVIITEGFGNLSISERILKILQPLHGQPASINGATQVRAGAMRPEIIVVDAKGAAAGLPVGNEVNVLQVGSRVRIIRVPFFGKFATVQELPHQPRRIPTGAEARVLVARLDNGEEVIVPRANVELV